MPGSERLPIRRNSGETYSNLEAADHDVRVDMPDAHSPLSSPSSVAPSRQLRKYKVVLALLLIVAVGLLIGLAVAVQRGNDKGGNSTDGCPGTQPERDVAKGMGGVVSSEHYLATEAGIEILSRGGNAIDAAAAVQFTLNVVQPQSTGIGGGCMFLVYNATTGTIGAMDGREEAPSSYSEEAFCKTPACAETWPFNDRITGGHPVGVPGTLKAVARAVRENGTLPLADVMAFAIDVAEKGFPMYDHLHERITLNVERLALFPASAALFLNATKNGPIVGIGETFRNPDLAQTFREIAEHGEEWFYDGPIGQAVVDAVAGALNPVTNLRGNISMSDLRNYRAVLRTPVSSSFGKFQVVGHALPSSGGLVMGGVLGVLRHVGISSMVPQQFSSLRSLIDAQNIGFSDRDAYLGDADFNPVPVKALQNATYWGERGAQLMHPWKAASIPVPFGVVDDPSVTPCPADRSNLEKTATTHFSVADKFGNVIAWTTTIEENLGSGVVVPNRGFLLNNELTDFDAMPTNPTLGCKRPNRPEGRRAQRVTALGSDSTTYGGKRPMSSMSPTLVLQDGLPVLALGSPGGSKIIGTVLNAMVPYLTQGQSLREAIDAPRVVSRNSVTLVETELFEDTALMSLLEGAGYQLTDEWGTRPLGFVQAVAKDQKTGELTGVADTKRLSVASAIAI